MNKIPKKIKFKQMGLSGSLISGNLGHNRTIAELIENAHNDLTMTERKFQDGLLDTLMSVYYEALERGIFIHLTRYTEGGSVAVVPKSNDGMQKTSLSSHNAPDEGDFLNKEAFLYFYENKALILSSGLSDKCIERYFTWLLSEAKIIQNNQSIICSDIANEEVLKTIREKGVRSLILRARVDQASWLYSEPVSFKSQLLRNISSLIQSDFMDGEGLSESEINDYAFELSINKKGKVIATERDPLVPAAIKIHDEAEEDDNLGYDIILNDGDSISAGSIKKGKIFPISKNGNALDVKNVKQAMVEYKKALIKAGDLNV